LHRYGIDATDFQPVRQTMQILRKAGKLPHGVGISVRGNGYVMGFITDINPRRVRMNYFQIQAPLRLLASDLRVPFLTHDLTLPARMGSTRPGCDWFLILFNGVELALIRRSRHHVSDRLNRNHA
jgi:hypothetical protein